jgi:cell division cycle 20-like protein 1 (cofactor of APC complex)
MPVDNSVTSVGWSNRGQHLAIGTHNGDTQIWDTTKGKIVRTLGDHLARVSSVSWNGSIVSTGSRDRTIYSRDLRAKNSIVTKHVSHK